MPSARFNHLIFDATSEVEPALMPPTIKDGGYHWIGCHQQWRSGPALATSSLRADKRQWCIRIDVLWLEKAFGIKNLPYFRILIFYTLPFSLIIAVLDIKKQLTFIYSSDFKTVSSTFVFTLVTSCFLKPKKMFAHKFVVS